LFQRVSTPQGPWLSLSLRAESLDSNVEKLRAFYEDRVRPHEGVVLKPEHYDKDVAPFLKWRNPEYLRLVYGYDYRMPKKYARLCKAKSVRNKLRASKEEYAIGLRMLAARTAEEREPEFDKFFKLEVRQKEEDPAL
jgi:hypothetical protein